MLKIGDRVICVKADADTPGTKLMTISTVIEVEPWEEGDRAPDVFKEFHYGVRVAGTKYGSRIAWPYFWRRVRIFECSCQFRPIDEVPKKEKKKRNTKTPVTLVLSLPSDFPLGPFITIAPGLIR